MATLDCYDAELDAFADLGSDFDFLSSQERESWLARQWTQVADGGGWRSDFDRVVNKLKQSQMGLVSLQSSALAAFSSYIRREREEPGLVERATVRVQVLTALQKQNPANYWRVEADVGSLPKGACFGLAQWQPKPGPKGKGPGELAAKPGEAVEQNAGHVTVLPHRAFLDDAGPSYFWTPAPTTQLLHLGCGWVTPLRLSLGTYPWVYGDRLQAPAPGMTWRSNSTEHPAPIALRMGVSFWHPDGNLATDARSVVSAWKHWRATTAPLVSALPSWSDPDPKIGAVYRDGELLKVHQGSEELAGINGPRGFVCVAAYNHVQERFAAFFALRRALLRARKNLTPELRKAIIDNPDPCIRQQLGLGSLNMGSLKLG